MLVDFEIMAGVSQVTEVYARSASKSLIVQGFPQTLISIFSPKPKPVKVKLLPPRNDEITLELLATKSIVTLSIEELVGAANPRPSISTYTV